MKFVLKLPHTYKGMDCIIFIVDKFLKIVHFISCNKMNDALVIDQLCFFKK
jgi:hypothetical protein